MYILAAMLLAIFVSSASAAGSLDPDLLEKSASRVLENIIRGTFEGDYSLYSRDFSSMMRQANDREAFLQLQRSLQKALGKFKSMEYLGSYRQLGQVITLFKARFAKEKDDVLIKLVLEERDGDLKVTGLWFDSPSLEK